MPAKEKIRMISIRQFLRGVAVVLVLLPIAAAVLTYYITFPGTSKGTCAIAPPGSSTNDWLCWFLYWLSGATAVCALLLLAMLGSLVWSRGSCYYLAAVLLFVVPFAAWIYAGVRVTQEGLDTNKLPGATDTALRLGLIGVAWATTGLLGLGLLLRLWERPGSIRRDDLDKMEAAKQANQAMMHQPFFKNKFTLPDGRVVDRQTMAKIVEQELLEMRTASYSTTGFVPDTRDPNDYIFVPDHPRWYGRLLLPAAINLSAGHRHQVLDQGHMNSCTANAAAAAMQYTIERFFPNQQGFVASRLFLYYNARVLVAKQDPRLDKGTYLRACCKALSEHGIAPESKWPYEQQRLIYKPSDEAYEAAKQYRHKFQYRKVPQDEYALKAALRQGFPVMCALFFPSENEDSMKFRGVLPMPTPAQLAGWPSGWTGHAVLLVGYDRRRRVFVFQNSWGQGPTRDGWYAHGFFAAPMALVLHPRLARDFWLLQPPSGCAGCVQQALPVV